MAKFRFTTRSMVLLTTVIALVLALMAWVQHSQLDNWDNNPDVGEFVVAVRTTFSGREFLQETSDEVLEFLSSSYSRSSSEYFFTGWGDAGYQRSYWKTDDQSIDFQKVIDELDASICQHFEGINGLKMVKYCIVDENGTVYTPSR